MVTFIGKIVGWVVPVPGSKEKRVHYFIEYASESPGQTTKRQRIVVDGEHQYDQPTLRALMSDGNEYQVQGERVSLILLIQKKDIIMLKQKPKQGTTRPGRGKK